MLACRTTAVQSVHRTAFSMRKGLGGRVNIIALATGAVGYLHCPKPAPAKGRLWVLPFEPAVMSISDQHHVGVQEASTVRGQTAARSRTGADPNAPGPQQPAGQAK